MSCNKVSDTEKNTEEYFCTNDYTGNYLDFFVIPDEVLMDRYMKDDKKCCIDIGFNNPYNTSYPCKVNDYFNDEKNVAKFKEYANYYGDTSYTSAHDMDVDENVIPIPVESINIIANRDFDEQHPAGTSLNNLFKLHYICHQSFIKNGYKNQRNGESCPIDSLVKLSDLKTTSLIGLYTSHLFFDNPTTSGKYTFTLFINFGEDPITHETLELPPASIEIEF